MTDREPLPEFIREALEDDLPRDDASRDQSRSRRLDALDAERSLGALLEAGWPEVGATPPSSELPASHGAAFEGTASRGTASQGTGAPSAALFARLESTISDAPHRYAPFFARAAELLDLPEEEVILELARLKNPKVWRFAGLPGIHHVQVAGGPRVQSAEALFVKFSPGVYFPGHRHTGHERVLVLEGSYRDSNGLVHRPGELREWAEGTEHAFKVDKGGPCIFASVVFGRRFHAWPLRALAKLLGR